MPRQMPKKGIPAAIRSQNVSRTPNESKERMSCPKWPTPGRMILSARKRPSELDTIS